MTIVNRRTFIPKRGYRDEVVAMLSPSENYEKPYRVYSDLIGTFDRVVLEIEFESVAEMDKAWTEWFASQEAEEFMKRFVEITETGGTNEVWNLHEGT